MATRISQSPWLGRASLGRACLGLHQEGRRGAFLTLKKCRQLSFSRPSPQPVSCAFPQCTWHFCGALLTGPAPSWPRALASLALTPLAQTHVQLPLL